MFSAVRLDRRGYRGRRLVVVVVVVVIFTRTGTLRPLRVGTRTVRVLLLVRRVVAMPFYFPFALPLPLELPTSTTVVFGWRLAVLGFT